MDRAAREQHFGWVYENNQWGRSPTGARYYSDSPSALTKPYRQYVSEFIREHKITSIVDLGCGDFMLSSGIDTGGANYVGVDLYDTLIKYNSDRFGNERHEFLVRDLVEDELPDGELCLISMTLYIMSHADVFAILPKLRKYRYVVITDGQPDIEPTQRQNIDKPTDKYTRQDYHGNGFYLELPPFNLDIEVVCEYTIPGGEVMRTVLIRRPATSLASILQPPSSAQLPTIP